MAAIGALKRFEHVKGYKLYQAARSLIIWRLDHRNGLAMSNLTKTCPSYAGLSNMPGQPRSFVTYTENEQTDFERSVEGQKRDLRLLQALIVLMALTSWGVQATVGHSLGMSGQVAMLVREIGLSTPDIGHNSSWEQWVEDE